VQIVADGRNSNTAGTAMGYVADIVEQFNDDWGGTHGFAPPPVRIMTRAWYNPNLETRWFMIPGIDRHADIDTDYACSRRCRSRASASRGRSINCWSRPSVPIEIMAGKALPSMLVGMVQATGVLLVAQLWFRIPFAGSYLTLYAGLLLFLLAAVGIGLLLSRWRRPCSRPCCTPCCSSCRFLFFRDSTTPLSSMPGGRAIKSDRK